MHKHDPIRHCTDAAAGCGRIQKIQEARPLPGGPQKCRPVPGQTTARRGDRHFFSAYPFKKRGKKEEFI